jgi:predicted membrane-bound mannosyltransferase
MTFKQNVLLGLFSAIIILSAIYIALLRYRGKEGFADAKGASGATVAAETKAAANVAKANMTSGAKAASATPSTTNPAIDAAKATCDAAKKVETAAKKADAAEKAKADAKETAKKADEEAKEAKKDAAAASAKAAAVTEVAKSAGSPTVLSPTPYNVKPSLEQCASLYSLDDFERANKKKKKITNGGGGVCGGTPMSKDYTGYSHCERCTQCNECISDCGCGNEGVNNPYM